MTSNGKSKSDLEKQAEQLRMKLLKEENPDVDMILTRPGREWSSEERQKIISFLQNHRRYFEIEARCAAVDETGHDLGDEFGRETWEMFAGDSGQPKEKPIVDSGGQNRG
jgi:hypothetical protein